MTEAIQNCTYCQTFEDHWAKRLGPGSAVERKYDAQRNAVLRSYGADKDARAYKDYRDEIESKFRDIEANREAEKAALQQEKDDEAREYGVYDARQRQSSQTDAPREHHTSFARALLRR